MNWNKGEIKILKLINNNYIIQQNHKKLLNELKNKQLKKYSYDDGNECGPCIRIEDNEDYFILCRGYLLEYRENDGWYLTGESFLSKYSLYYW